MDSVHILVFAAFAAATALGQNFCEDGVLVEVACPEDSLVIGIHTMSDIFSADASAVCSKTADKINQEEVVTVTGWYYTDSSKRYKADCSGSHNVVLKIEMCLTDAEIKIATHCRRLQDDVSPQAMYRIDWEPSSPGLTCYDGSVLNWIRSEYDNDGNRIIRAQCTVL